ncbi:MAG: sigma-54-dependent Fis family transcriptional regulator [Planctomycetes bacterium]|nr:sigma-54-dependent Fis family transcriptional regulator [Planctomycetota bacterium]
MLTPERAQLWMQRVRELTRQLAGEQELEHLPTRILDAAVELTEAERGYLLRVGRKPEGGAAIKVEAARGFDRTALQANKRDVSRRVIQRVIELGEGIVSSAEPRLLDATSLLDQRVLGFLCVPLCLNETVIGVLYLDHRGRDEAFFAAQLPFVQTFADQAALAYQRLGLRALEPEAPPGARPAGLLGSGPAMQQVFALIRRAAGAQFPVLVAGEAGSGRRAVATEIHRAWGSSLPLHVLDGEHASPEEVARVVAPQVAGTVYVREVGRLEPSQQATLAARVQAGAAPDAPWRLVASSSDDLLQRVRSGAFREDLYYGLVLRIELPPLRERPEDVLPLLARFLSLHGLPGAQSFSARAELLLRNYAWPGNLRQLNGEALRLIAQQPLPREISATCLSEEIKGGAGVAGSKGFTLRDTQREAIQAALDDAQGNKSLAAKRLGIPRSSLYRLMKRHGLS